MGHIGFPFQIVAFIKAGMCLTILKKYTHISVSKSNWRVEFHDKNLEAGTEANTMKTLCILACSVLIFAF